MSWQGPMIIRYSDFAAVPLTSYTVSPGNMAAKGFCTYVEDVWFDVREAFAGTGITAVTLDAGVTGALTKYFNGLNIAAAGGFTANKTGVEPEGIAIQVTVHTVGANLDQLTSGLVHAYGLFSQLPKR